MKVLWFKRSKELSMTQYVFYKIKRKNIIESSGLGACTVQQLSKSGVVKESRRKMIVRTTKVFSLLQ